MALSSYDKLDLIVFESVNDTILKVTFIMSFN